MFRKAALALAIGAGLVGISSARASAQSIVGRVYVAVPPAYIEIGPPPGPGYVWVPAYHRWEFRHYDRDFYRGREWHRYDRPYFEGHRDRR